MNDYLKQDEEGLRVTEQLKRAVRSEAVPPYLEARIRNTIRSAGRKPSWSRRLIPVAAAAAVCVAGGIAYELGHLRFTSSSQESYIASMSNRVGTLMRIGLGDHIHCSVFRKFRKDTPALEQLAQRLGPEYAPLIPIVREQVPEDYRLMLAHRCRYHDRQFVHFALKSDAKLVSLVIARKQDGESFEIDKVAPSLVKSDTPFYQAGVQRFTISSFETRDHLVYFVSDLAQEKNTELLVAMAPRVKQFLASKEL
jgi:hypothetical protein